MKRCLQLLVLAAGVALGAAGPEVVFQSDFNSPEEAGRWSSGKAFYDPAGGRNGTGGVRFHVDDSKDSQLISIRIDPDEVRGRAVVLEGWMKAEKVGKPRLSYLGPKLMMGLNFGDNISANPDQVKELGTYDWKKFSVYYRMPQSLNSITLCIGLQAATGTVWIDDVKLTRVPLPAPVKLDTIGKSPVQKETQFRGVMSGHDLSEAAFRELRDVWNANLMRFQISRGNGDHTTEAGFREIIRRNLERLDRTIPLARKYGVKLLIDMHVGPGTSLNALLSNQLSWDPKMQQLLTDIWREIAAKYKDEPAIWGYDLLNEPREENYVYSPDGGLDWNRLAEKIGKAIREVDPEKPIIVESAGWGSPAAFEYLQPINVPNVVYSFHFYTPGEYTHQGVHNRPSNIVYPGVIGKKEYNRDELEKIMQPVIDFQKKYNVPIYVGEFGVARWAPNSQQWLDDVISIFEKYGWDWTYHAFREYDGWDAEIGSDRNDTTRIGDTPNRRVLLKYMKKNRR